jgi:hypothetical protein
MYMADLHGHGGHIGIDILARGHMVAWVYQVGLTLNINSFARDGHRVAIIIIHMQW